MSSQDTSVGERTIAGGKWQAGKKKKRLKGSTFRHLLLLFRPSISFPSQLFSWFSRDIFPPLIFPFPEHFSLLDIYSITLSKRLQTSNIKHSASRPGLFFFSLFSKFLFMPLQQIAPDLSNRCKSKRKCIAYSLPRLSDEYTNKIKPYIDSPKSSE